MTKNFVAFDLGASSGRAVVGRFDGERLSLAELHRFDNGPSRLLDSLHWDVLKLFNEMKEGLRQAAVSPGLDGQIAAVGVDTWGVDFGLLDKDDRLIGNPYHYRDSRTDGLVEQAFETVPREEIFGQTGIQFIQLNSLFQLLAMKDSPALAAAKTLLFMPDLFNFWFTGQKSCEYTIASTSQCYNMTQNTWAIDMLERLSLPTHIFLDVVPPGTNVGNLLPHIVEEAGLSGHIPLIAPGCHDTASAVAAVPVADANKSSFAYISSGTWSLMGMETAAPVINAQSLAYNFTNEGGVQNTIRLLKNIMGLWLVQESRRVWAGQGEALSWNDLTDLARQESALVAVINPDDSSFFTPGDMPTRIREFCARTGQTLPESKGAVIRCALESLALKYRWVVEKLETMSGQPISVIHIVGGGSQNRLLNQFTANATGRPVITGPIEATAIGNILMQMLAVGEISSLGEGREVVKRSFPVETYQPEIDPAWDEAYERFLNLMS